MANNTDLVGEIDRCIQGAKNLKEYFRYEPGQVDAEHLLSTLQRVRDAIVKTQDELRLLSEAQDIMGRPQTAKQLMDIHDILSAYTLEETEK